MQDAVRYQWADEATRLLKDRQDARALEILDKLIAAYPDREDLLVSRAYCLSRLGRHGEAAAIHQRLANSAASSERVQRLGLFISKKAGPVFAAAPQEPAASAGVAAPEKPALAKKLETIRDRFANEIESHRVQHEESAAAIQRLRARLTERETAVQALASKNEELESLLTGLSTEVSGANLGASPSLAGDAGRSIEEVHARLDATERQLRERDDTLSTLFRKNGDLERSVRRLTADLDEAQSAAAAVTDTESELRRELQQARSEAIEARRAATEMHGLRTALQVAGDGARDIEVERDAVRARIAALERRLADTLARETRVQDINRALEARSTEQEQILEDRKSVV